MFDAADRAAAAVAESGGGECDEDPWTAGGQPAARGKPVAPEAAREAAGEFAECRALDERLAGLEAAGLANPFLLANEAVRGRVARIASREVVSFTSFDYLGLAGHPDVTQAAKEAIDRATTTSSTSSTPPWRSSSAPNGPWSFPAAMAPTPRSSTTCSGPAT
jgi:hypothetical protein